MRTIDFGATSAVRSQSVWHGLAAAMRPDDEPVLSFVQPAEPYVCLGYHRDIAEVDTEYCAAEHLPVLRRMVGGGPVYLDDQQYFFQITLPVSAVPGRRSSALATLLAPAVSALQSLGIPAVLDEFSEITVGEAKVCGHGAGQVGEGVAIVGNLITGFDHARATRILRLSDDLRREVLGLMQSYVVATPLVDADAWKAAMVREYEVALGRESKGSTLRSEEEAAIAEYDVTMVDPEFVAGFSRPLRPVRTIKVRAGVWVHEYNPGQQHFVVTIAEGMVRSVIGDLPADVVGLDVARAEKVLQEAEELAPLAAAMVSAHSEVAA